MNIRIYYKACRNGRKEEYIETALKDRYNKLMHFRHMIGLYVSQMINCMNNECFLFWHVGWIYEKNYYFIF